MIVAVVKIQGMAVGAKTITNINQLIKYEVFDSSGAPR